MSEVQCSFANLMALDTGDIDAVMRMNEACLQTLLDPKLWVWATGITLACIAVGAGIGWLKGRTLAGVVWATVLGPIGWLVVALMKVPQEPCPECGRGNPPEAKACRHCGVNLERAAQRSARSRLRESNSDGSW